MGKEVLKIMTKTAQANIGQKVMRHSEIYEQGEKLGK
jgi:hypothetical protein